MNPLHQIRWLSNQADRSQPGVWTKGFTLTEILFVVGLIVALLIVAIPAVQQVSLKASSTKCINNLRQLHQALVGYASEHSGKFPMAQNDNPPKTSWLTDIREGGYIPNVYLTKNPSQYVNFCPASKVRDSERNAIDYTGHYGMNRGIGGRTVKGAAVANPLPSLLQNITEPSKKMLLVDAGISMVYQSMVNGSGGGNSYIPGVSANKEANWDEAYKADAIHGRHHGRVNLLMVDGHVEAWVPDDLLTSPSVWQP